MVSNSHILRVQSRATPHPLPSGDLNASDTWGNAHIKLADVRVDNLLAPQAVLTATTTIKFCRLHETLHVESTTTLFSTNVDSRDSQPTPSPSDIVAWDGVCFRIRFFWLFVWQTIVSVLASYVNLAADHDFHDEDSLVFGYASAMASDLPTSFPIYIATRRQTRTFAQTLLPISDTSLDFFDSERRSWIRPENSGNVLRSDNTVFP
ncbi:uncharacterized protein LACBIDRAFT_335338 [Laccaria bicolor S238N-H82]|uniref:Predicted protein n=1 Tax=Laccaria bicolor (strain S238N-H82 / ATCC MYA-4686) TaxID=486041 RepID=B0E215_LACBS|nr:uncharacterized protein LACBIDRAFT_335338 [Laccaria bicolor S238N-H82]EDQ99092.1 predicted protein [Laccaria bicolor S238N-H82]|eukprot:XP_001890225.1 predicted protein [Laccaria bicolor S238N-H82]